MFCLFAAQAAFVAGQREPERLQVTEQEQNISSVPPKCPTSRGATGI